MFVRNLLIAISAIAIATPSFGEDYNLPPEPKNLDFEAPSLAAGEKEVEDVRPAEWFWFSSVPEMNIDVTDARKKNGMQSCSLKMQKADEAYQGIAQRFSAVQGHHYTFVVYVMNNPQDAIAGEAYGQISFEWQDASGKEISRDYGPSWGHDLPFKNWSKYNLDAKAPENAAMGVAVITLHSKNSNGNGMFFVDDCRFSSRSGQVE